MMKQLTIAVIASVLTSFAASAEIYNYSCKDNGRSYPLRVDTKANTLQWRGSKFNISNANDPDKDKIVCAKAGWHAEKDGISFDFCTATKGYADFRLGNVKIQCDLNRQ